MSVSITFAGAAPRSDEAYLMLPIQSSKLVDTLLETMVSENDAVGKAMTNNVVDMRR